MYEPLTKREEQILESISRGNTINEIASDLYFSPHTVITYRRNLLIKIDARNGAELIRKAFELRLLHVGYQISKPA
jgi:DNA-binding NarL/FixJ family response regulator